MTTLKALPLTCSGHSRPVTHVSFGEIENRPFLISACKDALPILRNGATGDWIGTYLGHKGSTWCSRMSQGGDRDSTLVCTASADFTCKIWRAATGEELHSIEHPHIVRSCCFSQSGKLLATSCQDGHVRVYQLKDDKYQQTHCIKTMSKTVLWVQDASEPLLIVCTSKGIEWWSVKDTSEPMLKGQVSLGDTPGPFEISGGLLVGPAGNQVYVLDSLTREVLKCHKLDYNVSAVAVSPDRDVFQTGNSGDTWVRVHRYETGELVDTWKGHHGPVHTVAYSPNGDISATGSEDGTVRLWKIRDGPFGLWR
ncbi:WD40-repeat-containing domain protein [Yarrowia lipolytica]|uniref:Serine-threonine kinase receptor-associated protein n=2 Tax=Yarrowia lipolytica TaxID=4952 RepID=Q6C2H3_YARLI|nr:YALI0F07887p [Yarrowia lipolytica CLIB122]AOW06828.1 hypothetical protein YALI1_F11261g [Yarrowia lipolytica]KAB8284105.1 WD40-repeat-containing domain protein [Yarrowia lipolytica]KAE8173692.1 WD40-repeat-containing domain protein [Yarrowia lipolytica]KAJ8055975.1 WD40-repeat-containing domain protein [Yarrowia lipolytica]RDW28545.1 WD40-repeat-containing domain protein [Yarrowia lipolytica]|eukprot:XP_505139.1 YALI0F07887p [Yarrowia lipolytica CLIB122]